MMYIIVVLLLKMIQHVFNKESSRSVKGFRMIAFFSTARQLAAAALGFVTVLATADAASVWHVDRLTLLLALMMAVSLAVCLYGSLMALKCGTMVLSSLFCTAGVFVPCIAGVFLLDEPLGSGQLVGLLLFMGAAYLLIGCSKEMYCHFSWRTMLYLLMVLLGDGCTMLAQKLFSHYVPDGDAGVFNTYAFFFSGVLCLLMLVVFSATDRGEKRETVTLSPRLLLYGMVLAAVTFGISQLSTLAAETVPSIILFPLSNGGGMLLVAVLSAVLYRERLTGKAVIGLALGLLALLAINFF